jgi:hypothetical protein
MYAASDTSPAAHPNEMRAINGASCHAVEDGLAVLMGKYGRIQTSESSATSRRRNGMGVLTWRATTSTVIAPSNSPKFEPPVRIVCKSEFCVKISTFRFDLV